MKKTISAAVAAAMFGASMIAVAPPAFADAARDSYIMRYYQNNPHDRDYRRWQRDRHRWSERDYRRWYQSRRHNNNAVAAGIFGLAAGAILGGAVANSGASAAPAPSYGSGAPPAGGHPFGTQGYYNYCASKYRSFDANTGTFVGYDGQRRYCQ